MWADTAWRSLSHVHVLTERVPIPIQGGTLFPCPLYRKRSDEDPTAWISSSNSEGVRVGLAHGHAGDTPNGDGSYPIPLDAAKRAALDYLALGHWHSTTLYSGARMAYSGTHEQTKFGERDSGNVLVVGIDERGSEPQISTVRTGALSWRQIDESVTAEGALADVVRALSRLTEPSSTLLDIRLSGLLFGRDVDELSRIERACARFLYARIDRTGLKPAPSDDSWLESLPPGLVQQTALRLRDLAVAPGRESDVATQALIELYAMASEVSA